MHRKLKKLIAMVICMAVMVSVCAPMLPVRAAAADPNEGIMTLAAGDAATLKLNVWAYSNNQVIPFSGGNNVSCTIGSTVTFVLRDDGGTYATHALRFDGCELVSAVHNCGQGTNVHRSGDWCGNNPVYTFTVRVTSANATVGGDIGWLYDGNNTYSVSGAAVVTPTPTPTVTPTPTPTVTPNPGTNPTPTPTPTPPPTPTPVISNQVRPDLPTAVTTGGVNVSALRFYNLCEGDNGVAPLAGCVFEVVGDNGYRLTLTSTNSPEIILPADMPNGTYTITEVSVPNGYMRDTEYRRTFTVNNGKFDHNDNIGTFINHDLHELTGSKTAEVEDYNNRIYRILLDAENHMRMYEMDPVDVLFVVDQSNSMLFPSGLTSTGKRVTLDKRGYWNTNNMDALNLDKSQTYYIISDPHGTSTVWALYWNGSTWLYQDASYYAKAKHDNRQGYQDPSEKAVIPGDYSYAEQSDREGDANRANGGGLSKDMNGSGLYNYINTMGDTAIFEVYTASDPYNRLHYLEESLTNMIYELANANDQNRVTLIGFTKELKMDVGPYYLTPDNTEYLVGLVNSINTGGGTRQDIGLKTAFNEHLNNAGEGFNRGLDYTHTILITDGAPVRSGSDAPPLGNANSAPTTAENGEIYGQIKGWANQVKTKSSLMTVGLGMKDVQGGHDVLNQIASAGHFCALDDAAQLVREMQELLFDNFRAKDEIYLYGDIVDEISDSFYPIAWVEKGQGESTGRTVLKSNIKNSDGTTPEIDANRDWVLLQPGDRITLEGKYTTAGAKDAAGQLSRKDDGTFYITWSNAQISDPAVTDRQRIAWVPAGQGASSGREVFATDGTYDWVLLREGDWITPQGQYQTNPPTNWWDQRNYGQITKANGEWSVAWGSDANGNNRRYYEFSGWNGTFYVKAKEDFIGGNAIDTNKTAYITATDGEGTTATKYFDLPTVNVRLLDMNEMSSRVTVYLGDRINEAGDAPMDSIEYFWDNTRFTKLVSGDGDVLNKVPITAENGLKEANFHLKYALGRELTEEEWQTLKDGGEVRIEYTYDDPSSHGPVGCFTFSLEKMQAEGSAVNPNDPYGVHHAAVPCPTNEGHTATEVCDHPVETYTLNVTYTAYKLGEKVNGVQKRPEKNVFNGQGSPGAEVGTGSTLPTGAGVVDKDNIHEVHVICGVIRIIKHLNGTNPDADLHFTFTLHRVENGSSEFDETRTITIPAGHSEGEASFAGLYRGTYVITEIQEADSLYQLTDIEILGSTNCENTLVFNDTTKSVTFVMGNNVDGENVIGKAVDANGNQARYTSYIDPVNGVLGEVIFTNSTSVVLPVTGGSGTHMYYFGGLLLTAAALIYGCALRRRNRKEAST